MENILQQTRHMPKFLHEVFGEQQSIAEILIILSFAIIGSFFIYNTFLQTNVDIVTWRLVLAFILIADILAGCLANFTRGTNDFYARRPSNRLMFIAMHVHILAVAWLMKIDMTSALLIWAITISSALLINSLIQHALQKIIAAALLAIAILVLLQLSQPAWFVGVSLFFIIKVMFSFAVDHYRVGSLSARNKE